jgi:hypothetical protein
MTLTSDTEVPEKYIRLGENDVYGYTELLATRRDATIIDGYAAAQLLRRQGITNELTERYPDAVRLNPLPQPTVSVGDEQKAERVAIIAAREAKIAERIRVAKRTTEFEEQQKPGIPETSTEVVEGLPVAETPISSEDIRGLLGDVTHRT